MDETKRKLWEERFEEQAQLMLVALSQILYR